MSFSCLIGDTISGIKLHPEKEGILFEVEKHAGKSFEVEGDCCSGSWIAHMEVEEFIGAKVLGYDVKEIFVDEKDDTDEYVQVYGFDVVLQKPGGPIYTAGFEFRNGSNGYYGGWIERIPWADTEMRTKDYIQQTTNF